MFKMIKRIMWACSPGLMRSLKERRAASEERRAQADIATQEDRNVSDIFGEIYRDGLWGGDRGQFYSGAGSDDEVSAEYVAIVRKYIDDHDIRSIVDLGCGDFRVGRQLLRPGISYVGVDLVPQLIDSHQKQFGSETVRFMVGNISEDALPDGQLYLVRQVLQHLSNAQVGQALDKLRDKPHVLIAEHHPGAWRFKEYNRDKTPGQAIRVPYGSGVYPDQPPFSFPCKIIGSTWVPQIVTEGETLTIYAKT
jgi:SAM-dependent methyltransferase